MFWTVSHSLSLFVVHLAEVSVLTFMVCVRGLRLCPSHWRGGLVYKGMDKGSFDDVTSFILRRHQINLCLSLLKIYAPSSSTSSTSSSPFASSQRKSPSQHTCSWSQLVLYPEQLIQRNGFIFFYEHIALALWRLIKSAKLLHCLIFRKSYCLSNPPSHILLHSERMVKSDELWKSVLKSALQ